MARFPFEDRELERFDNVRSVFDRFDERLFPGRDRSVRDCLVPDVSGAERSGVVPSERRRRWRGEDGPTPLSVETLERFGLPVLDSYRFFDALPLEEPCAVG